MKLVDIEPYKGKVIASHTYCGVNKLIEVDALEEISEQEIVKPYLDKIRAELHATAELHDDGDYYLRDEWIDEIFDKYKAERSEE